jgi:hypothetical protein
MRHRHRGHHGRCGAPSGVLAAVKGAVVASRGCVGHAGAVQLAEALLPAR